MCNLGEGIEERATKRAEERMTAQYVTSLFTKNFQPEQIANGLDLSLDKVIAILTGQGLLSS